MALQHLDGLIERLDQIKPLLFMLRRPDHAIEADGQARDGHADGDQNHQPEKGESPGVIQAIHQCHRRRKQGLQHDSLSEKDTHFNGTTPSIRDRFHSGQIFISKSASEANSPPRSPDDVSIVLTPDAVPGSSSTTMASAAFGTAKNSKPFGSAGFPFFFFRPDD
jgi:hypothetical protein